MPDDRPGRVHLTIDDKIAVLTIDNARAANALSREMLDELGAGWQAAEERADVRAVAIIGTGERHFCAGITYDALESRGGGERLRLSAQQFGVTKPVIAALNGAVVGGAIALVTDADIVIASRSAFITDPHVSLGLVTGYASLRLVRALPPSEAARVVIGGDGVRIDAERAFQLGVVSELLPDATSLRTRALQLARIVAANSPVAVRTSLAFVRELSSGADREILARAGAAARRHRAHPDAYEGLGARREGRAPRWSE